MKGKLILFVSAIIIILGFFSQSAYAFSCAAGPDSWFAYRLDLDKITLPPGVEFKTQNEYVTGNEYGKFSLKNNGNIPLYLIETPDSSKPVYSYPNSELPLLVIPRHKLVDGKAYYYSIYEPNIYSYQQNAGGTDSSPAAYELDLSQEELSKMGVKVENIYQDDRPASTTPPPPQDFSIIAYHGNKQIVIKGLVTYLLNEDYDPKASVKSQEACNRAAKAWEFEQAGLSIIPLVGKILLSTLAILGAILIYRYVKKKMVKKLFLIFLSILLLSIIAWSLILII